MSWWLTDDPDEFRRRQKAHQEEMDQSAIAKTISDRKNEGTLGHPFQTRRAVERSADDEKFWPAV